MLYIYMHIDDDDVYYYYYIFPDSSCLQWREVYEKDTDWGSLYLA